MIKFYPEGLPQGLKDKAHWCVWRYEQPEGRDKPTKVPYNPGTGGRAMSNNPNTFTSYQEAVNALERGGYDGLGVGIFSGLCAIDIDGCLDEDGTPSPLAVDVISTMESYTETSPSGRGVRIFFRAPGFTYDKDRYYTMNASRDLEIYVSGATSKFLTVTGNSQPWGGSRPIEERGTQLQSILERYMERPQQVPQEVNRTPQTPVYLSDEEIITRAHSARNGAAFAALWNGDTSAYGSHSEADLALCNMLAYWTGGDAEQADRLFRASGLMREKWDRPQNGSTYGGLTVQKALELYHSADGKSSVRPGDFSDAGNAETFRAVNEGRLLFTDSLGWLVWNGQRWERSDHQALTLATELSRDMLADAQKEYRAALVGLAEAKADEVGPKELEQATNRAASAKAYLTHAKQTRSAGRLKNMLELAKPAFVVRADILDANPADLNTPAGIVDLTTGELRPHDRAARCSQITAVSPGEQGTQMWMEFLDTITQGDGSLKGFLQLVAGMALHGKVYHEGLILAHGAGRNGKSTFFNALSLVLGDYAGSLAIDVFTTDRQNRGASLATLRGKRLVIAGELEEGRRLSVATVKKVCSTDRITIEEKYKAPETITPSHTLCLFTNHLPRVGSTDPGTWRRLIVVPFRATISTQKTRSNYGDTLVQQAGPSILAWAIEGAVNFAHNGYQLQMPDVVEEVTEAYRGQEDWLSNFITECCILNPDARARAGELYQEYRAWAQRNGDYVRRLPDFNTAMEAAGFHKIAPGNRKTWEGLSLFTTPVYSIA
nr:phage/plasmid primase, P4 family [uncultured Oscillibacter sp.]